MIKKDDLSIWLDRVMAYVKSGLPDLTNRQLAVAMIINQTKGPHTVRGLAALLGVARPVITRAVTVLSGYGFVQRERDISDRRNVLLTPTSAGQSFLGAVANQNYGQIRSGAGVAP